MISKSPPTKIVGSRSPSRVICEIIDVHVVLPWVPATATLYLWPFIINPKNSALSINIKFCFLASIISGLLSGIAAVYTTKSTSTKFLLSWPMYICAPFFLSLSRIADSLESEPETLYPLFNKTAANPLILIPPIPMKWIFICLSFIKSNDKLSSPFS